MPGSTGMRDYQLEALNWLIRLHDQKINGILADEMGEATCVTLHAIEWLFPVWLAHPLAASVPLPLSLFSAGLGKTLMSLSLLAYLKQYRGYAGPHLIIVPKSTSSNWLREVNRWTSNLTVHKFHGNAEEREAQKPGVAQNDITITTYEMVIMEKSFLSKVKWHYIVRREQEQRCASQLLPRYRC